MASFDVKVAAHAREPVKPKVRPVRPAFYLPGSYLNETRSLVL